ncbi:MAG: ATPase [Candidatus Lokiarchaeota archaeon]|nr:ATPase [Candidatus Lokiarchaeota archaeon]
MIRQMKNRYLPDSSVIISGQILDFIQNLDFKEDVEIVLSRVVLAEIENNANQDKTTGIVGIEMLNDLRKIVDDLQKERQKTIKIRVYGERPSLEQIKLNTGGELDAVIRIHANDVNATLITSDDIQAQMAEIEQIPTIKLKSVEEQMIKGQRIQHFFDNESMSVHLKAGCYPMAKKGSPGHWQLVAIGDKLLTRSDLEEIGSNIIKEAKNDINSFIERDLPGVTVVQLKTYRIVICKPPFADGNEITAVRPLVSLSLSDYDMNEPLVNRLERAEGILVAGSPGAGKSTFISALTEFYLDKRKIVKTLESVRDLQVPPEVSQYGELDGDFEKTADILLLVRPDFTLFDEIRTTGDFKIFSDMRLAGVGMVGVIHASSALDAIQRFIRRIELGVLPSVVDTVIFIREGQIDEILKMSIRVKVPYGIKDVGLARPVVEIRDYVNNKLMYEIYEFGSNIIVTPVGKGIKRKSSYKRRSSKKRRKSKKKYNKGRSYSKKDSYYEKYMDNPSKPSSNYMGVDYGTDNKDSRFVLDDNGEPVIKFGIVFGKKSLVLKAGTDCAQMYVDIFADDMFVASCQINKYGDITISKDSPLYKKLDVAVEKGMEIYGKKT